MERRILVIDDDPSMIELLQGELARRDFDVVAETSAERALELLAAEPFAIVLTDVKMRGMDGVDLCRKSLALHAETPVVLMSAFASVESAIAAIRAGAYDYVTKPFAIEDVVLTIERALKHRELHQEVKRLREVASTAGRSADLIGDSDVMRKMYDLMARVATTDSTVLVTGESGTGKELVAKALHAQSARASGPFIAINCAAMPESLLESELFGHVKGAFTDARGPRAGLFVKATGGTLLLDEVGEMPLGMQAKLLRALQERTVRPVGSDTETTFDTRIIAATNRDLEGEVRAHRFREDLFYRINVVHIAVPPLRARGNDVLALAQHFLVSAQGGASPQRVLGLTSDAAGRLLSHDWPGNVRELQNCMERALALTRYDHVGVEDLPERVRGAPGTTVAIENGDPAQFLPIEEVERRYVEHVLAALKGNKALAARVLRMDRRTLYRKLDRWRGTAAQDGGAKTERRDDDVCPPPPPLDRILAAGQ